MATSAKPYAAASLRSAHERPARAGRQTSTRMIAANSTRTEAVPAGPISSKSVLATAPPNWTDATAANTRSVGGIRSARTMAVHRTETAERSHEELERIFEGVDAPFALVDLDAMWSNAAEMLARARGTPIRVASKSVRCRAAARGDPRARRGLPRADDVHAHGVALAPRTRLRRPPARLPHGRPRRARRARAPGGRGPADRDGRLGRAARPDRGGRRTRGTPDPRLHRARPELVAARRPREDRREALSDPHPGPGPGAGARDRPPAWARAGRAHGLRGPHRRPGRPSPREAHYRSRRSAS